MVALGSGAGNLGSLVLAPGVYTSAAGSFMIEGGDLTLDAMGDANAVWVFQMASTLSVGGPGAAFPQNVMLVNGAQAKNVYWQVEPPRLLRRLFVESHAANATDSCC